MFDTHYVELATDFLKACREQGVMVATAESCTGGLIAALLTEIAGSSDVVDRGFVTYSNAAKMQLLGVPQTLIAEHGAVSEPVARAMAEGALKYSGAQLTVSVTGIAGPGGGSAEKPVGLVHFGCAMLGQETLASHKVFSGNRSDIRLQALEMAVKMMQAQL